VIIVPDPTDVILIDELEVLLGTPIAVAVSTKTAIQASGPNTKASHTRSFQIGSLIAVRTQRG
jgi:hypothetical protein